MLVECLSVGRGITLPSNATGGLKSVAMATGAPIFRRQFKISIGKMEGEYFAGLMDARSIPTAYRQTGGEQGCNCGQRSTIDAMDNRRKGIMLR